MHLALGVIILGIAVGLRHHFILPRSKDWLYFALLGFLGITFHQWLQSTGLVTSQATTTGWIVASMPIFIAILGWLVLKENLKWLQVMGILLAAIGVLLVITHGDLISLVSGKFGTPGDILILISAPNWAILTILSRSGLKTCLAALMM
jgi:drug/metabolite transporter (DMT)-like permease